MAEDQLFYVGLKAVIEKEGKVLLLNDPEMGVDLPGGKIQIGETDFLEVLDREINEESGLKTKILGPFSVGYFKFPINVKHRHAGKELFIVFFKAKYLSGDVVISDEHNSYEWADKDAFKDLAAKTKGNKNIINALKKYFEISIR